MTFETEEISHTESRLGHEITECCVIFQRVDNKGVSRKTVTCHGVSCCTKTPASLGKLKESSMALV